MQFSQYDLLLRPWKRLSNTLLSQKLGQDIAWSMLGFIAMALGGILLNILIISFYDAATLGVFNIFYAIFFVAAQVATGGSHLSTLKHVSEHSTNTRLVNTIVISALAIAIIYASAVIVFLALVKDLFGTFFKSIPSSNSLLLILPGILFYAFNKILISYYNGLRRIKAVAVFNSLRVLLLLVFLFIFVSSELSGYLLPIILSATEASLFLIISCYSLIVYQLKAEWKLRYWLQIHFVFGIKALGANVLIEVNNRIDLLILGIFSAEAIVGIYSFAATIADGLNQMTVVFRTVFNPILTRLTLQQNREALETKIRNGIGKCYLIFIPLGLLVMGGFVLLSQLSIATSQVVEIEWLFCILLLGTILSSGYLPFQMILNQTGFPGLQSLHMLLYFGTNLILNLALIPLFGAYGAALAVSISYVLQIYYLKSLVRKSLLISI